MTTYNKMLKYPKKRDKSAAINELNKWSVNLFDVIKCQCSKEMCTCISDKSRIFLNDQKSRRKKRYHRKSAHIKCKKCKVNGNLKKNRLLL
jgi:hypothetical protein